jgi:hypothetical protein
VVDEIVSELAERRTAIQQRSAYVALARAILSEDEASPSRWETQLEVPAA